MPSLLPTPEPADPVEGQPGHFEHSNWLKASVKALDSGVVHKADSSLVQSGTFVGLVGGSDVPDTAQGLGKITFPVPFSAPPVVVLTPGADPVGLGNWNTAGYKVAVHDNYRTPESVIIRAMDVSGNPLAAGSFVRVHWVAVGPR